VRLWKCIRKGWDGFLMLGDGTKVHFWHDVWCLDQPLKLSFLELFTIACCKDAWWQIICSSGMNFFFFL
jgi:hypothetical protein